MNQAWTQRPVLATWVTLSGLFYTAGIFAATGTVCGYLGRFAWWLDLCAHFRVQYLLILLAAALCMLAVRRGRAAAVFALLAFVNLLAIAPLYVGPAPPAPASPSVLRAMLLNVNTYSGDPRRVVQAILEHDPDIIVLEEISRSWLDALAVVRERWPYVCAQPRDDNFGIGLFSRLPFARADVVYLGTAAVPSLAVEIRTVAGSLAVMATHPLPPVSADYARRRNDQLTALADHVRQLELPVLLLGDLNVTPWSAHFRRLLRASGLCDSARGYGVQPTWPAGMPWLWIPIDHCLHTPDVRIMRRAVGPAVGSDHYPLIVDLQL